MESGNEKGSRLIADSPDCRTFTRPRNNDRLITKSSQRMVIIEDIAAIMAAI